MLLAPQQSQPIATLPSCRLPLCLGTVAERSPAPTALAHATTSVRLGAEYLWIKRNLLLPIRAGFFYDPEPGANGTDDFFGFSLGSGITVQKFVFDLAYQFRTGTVESQATDTTVYQHNIFASVIYHF